MTAAPNVGSFAALSSAWDLPLSHARARHAAGIRVALASAHTVPRELLHAAGFDAVVHRPTAVAVADANPHIEAEGLGTRAKSLLESAVAGEFDFASVIVCSRSSEQDYKVFLYLREFARQGLFSSLPPVWLYDLLQTRTPAARAYGLERTRDLYERLSQLAGRCPDEAGLADAIVESNAARALMRRLLSLRQPQPRVSGVMAMTLLGAFSLVDPPTYAAVMTQAIEALEQSAPLTGPRLLLAGAPADGTRLHAVLEAMGAVVVAETGGWGTRSASSDISLGGDPIASIFEHYYEEVPNPREDRAAEDVWFERVTRAGIDGVVFYLPPDDSVVGWDYPRQRSYADQLGLPSLVVRDDTDDPELPSRWRDRITTLLERASARG